MARQGNFGGFYFDEEVFADMMREEDFWKNEIAASGIVRQDSTIMDLIAPRAMLPQFLFTSLSMSMMRT